MPDPAPQKRPYAGGFLLIVSILAGTIAGLIYHQPAIGFLIGAAIGVVLAVGLYLADLSRKA